MTLTQTALSCSSPELQDGRSLLQGEGVDMVEARTPAVAVVGLGYVGLSTALSIASPTFPVAGIDVSRHRIESIQDGRVDLLPADRDRLGVALAESYLTLADAGPATLKAAAVLICVSTPVDDHLVPDLSFVESACAAVVEHGRPGQTIILTSTICVGTTRRLLVEPLAARGLVPGTDVFVAYSPEGIGPGNGDRTQASTPRVVGGATPRCVLRTLPVLGQITSAIHTVASLEAAEFTNFTRTPSAPSGTHSPTRWPT